MSAIKRLGRSRTVQRLVGLLASLYIRLVHLTGRWEHRNDAPLRALIASGAPLIVAFWHGRLLMIPALRVRERPAVVLISQHRDGALIASAMPHFGIEAIRGSSTRGGDAALRQLLRRIREGYAACITPDGPRGPRMRASAGIVHLARLSGAAIIPVTYGVSRRRVLKSWDRFIIALPFSRGVFCWGDPIRVPRNGSDADIEQARQALEETLNTLSETADRLCGQEPISPAPPAEDTDEKRRGL